MEQIGWEDAHKYPNDKDSYVNKMSTIAPKKE